MAVAVSHHEADLIVFSSFEADLQRAVLGRDRDAFAEKSGLDPESTLNTLTTFIWLEHPLHNVRLADMRLSWRPEQTPLAELTGLSCPQN